MASLSTILLDIPDRDSTDTAELVNAFTKAYQLKTDWEGIEDKKLEGAVSVTQVDVEASSSLLTGIYPPSNSSNKRSKL